MWKVVAAVGAVGGAVAARLTGWPTVMMLGELPLALMALVVWVLRRQELTDRAVELLKAGRGKRR